MPALEAACEAVWAGASLFSASETPFFASAGGQALGTSRAISAMIRSLTGSWLTVTGKPSLPALRAAADRLGVPRLRDLAVGGGPGPEYTGFLTSVPTTTSRENTPGVFSRL
jgi:4-nitrophenyl phosphatase